MPFIRPHFDDTWVATGRFWCEKFYDEIFYLPVITAYSPNHNIGQLSEKIIIFECNVRRDQPGFWTCFPYVFIIHKRLPFFHSLVFIVYRGNISFQYIGFCNGHCHIESISQHRLWCYLRNVLCLWGKTISADSRAAMFFTLKAFEAKTPHLPTSFNFSNTWHPVDCDMFNIFTISRVPCHALLSTKWL